MVVAPTLLGPDLEARPQVGKVFACEQFVLAGIGAPDGLCPDLAASPQAARMFETLSESSPFGGCADSERPWPGSSGQQSRRTG